MFERIFLTIVCLLAVYGVVRLVILVYGYLAGCTGGSDINRHTVLFFQDNENEAEGVVRALAVKRSPLDGEIIAVYHGTGDDALPILRRLEKEYEFLHIMNTEEYIDYIWKIQRLKFRE